MTPAIEEMEAYIDRLRLALKHCIDKVERAEGERDGALKAIQSARTKLRYLEQQPDSKE